MQVSVELNRFRLHLKPGNFVRFDTEYLENKVKVETTCRKQRKKKKKRRRKMNNINAFFSFLLG